MGDTKRISHCSHWGAYTILVRDNEILDIEPSPFDPQPSPIIHSAKEWAKADRRILQPMVREGWLNDRENSRHLRGQDRFVPISWEKANELVAGEISRVSREFGNASIFAGSYGWASCGRFHHSQTMVKRLLNLVGGFTRHVDTYSHAAGPVMLRHVLGSTDALMGKATTLDTVAEHSQTLLVLGSLSPRTAQCEAGGITRRSFEDNLRKMVDAGVNIFHVSPLRDDMPEWSGAEWWPVRPNTDTALLLALACEIVQSGLHDRDFLERHCSGADTFLAYLSGAEDGVVKDADWAASITDLDATAIRALAKRMTTTRTMIAMSWSLQRAHHGEQPYWAAIALAAVIGQIGLPGGGFGFGYASLGGVGGPMNYGKNPAISAGDNVIDSFIPCARIADLLTNPGGRYSYEGKERTYPDTRLVYWAGGNPFHHHQDLNRLSQAFQRPETIIVQDPFFTATALHADILLPATSSIERNDIAASGRSDMMIAMQQAIVPLGEARSDYDICAGIAEKLGVTEAFTEGRDEMAWLRYLYEDARKANAERYDFEMPDFDQFWSQGYALAPAKDNVTYLAEFRANPDTAPLKTESGRIVLTSELLKKLDYEDCRSHPAWLEPLEWLGANGATDRLHLISYQPPGRLHSQLETGAASLAQKTAGREITRISPEDASRLNLREQETVRIWNARGACLATVHIDDAVRPGVLVLPTGAWLTQNKAGDMDSAGNPNILTPDIPASSFSQGCAAHTCLVSVEAWRQPVGDALSDYGNKLERMIASG